MKDILIIAMIALVAFAISWSVVGAKPVLFKDKLVAEIGPSANQIKVYKFEDTVASSTCYVAKAQYSGPSLSCVR